MANLFKWGGTAVSKGDPYPDDPFPVTSLTPKKGVNYTNGISGLDAETINLFSKTISNNNEITNETLTVYVDYGKVHLKISVADQIMLDLNGTNYALDIIGFNHDTLTDSNEYGEETATGKAGVTLQLHDLFETKYPMNIEADNDVGWWGSDMRISTMEIMKGYLPADWQAIIKPVNNSTYNGYGAGGDMETSSDSCFLLSEVEIFGSDIWYTFPGEGSQYAYYKAGNSKIKTRNGTAEMWWERSPVVGQYQYCTVSVGGRASNENRTYSRGVSFAFCV